MLRWLKTVVVSDEEGEFGFGAGQPVETVSWGVIATDGAYEPMAHLGIRGWKSLTSANAEELERLLRQCQEWEQQEDPTGQGLPRAKKHDDKSLAVISFGN